MMMFTRLILTQWVMQFVMLGVIFLIPYYLQRMMGMTALQAGLWTLPQALASAVFMPIGGKLYDRIGPRPLVVTGLKLVTIGSYLLSTITSQDEAIAYLIPRILLGMAMGMSFLSLNTFLIQSAPRSLVSRVTSLTSALQQVITSISVAGLATIIANRVSTRMSQGEVEFDALAHAYSDAYIYLMFLAMAGILLGLTLRKINHPKHMEFYCMINFQNNHHIYKLIDMDVISN
jgi:MFS family permease